ncbi:hypothetical protein PR048_008366 [Dryococelus australis]|uniref:Uncharacterized protein n=1 Tax=Dryococelus australis TaxID=614101 RepID=A0ABQ9HWX4_9NEOP|nr:hypothetical protein PR048_008366 [Dryococelus australis]
MERRRNARAGKTGDLRANPKTRGIVRHDSHMRKSGSDPAGNVILTTVRHISDVCARIPVQIVHDTQVEWVQSIDMWCIRNNGRSGAAVAERLARPPPTKAIRAQSPAGSQDPRMWESCRTMPLVGGSSRGSPASPPPPITGRRPILTPIAPIGSEGLAVKSRPNLFTHCTPITPNRQSEKL